MAIVGGTRRAAACCTRHRRSAQKAGGALGRAGRLRDQWRTDVVSDGGPSIRPRNSPSTSPSASRRRLVCHWEPCCSGGSTWHVGASAGPKSYRARYRATRLTTPLPEPDPGDGAPRWAEGSGMRCIRRSREGLRRARLAARTRGFAAPAFAGCVFVEDGAIDLRGGTSAVKHRQGCRFTAASRSPASGCCPSVLRHHVAVTAAHRRAVCGAR